MFYSKDDTKTQAEKALEAGRAYVLKPEKKSKPKRNNHKPLSFDLLDKIEDSIQNENVKKLNRAESTDRIKFPVRIQTELEKLVQIPNKYRLKKRRSLPDLLDFEQFKQAQGYKNSSWFIENQARSFNPEKEWTRDVWTIWFDEVIPQLDGSGGREAAEQKQEAKKSAANKLKKQQQQSRLSTSSISVSSSKFKQKKSDESFENAAAIIIEENSGDSNNVDGDEDNKEDGRKKIVKSPTPYDTFEQISLDQIDADLICTLETEIEVLTERIEAKTNAFDLTRRGAIYRKLGFIKLALNDLNKALTLEMGFIDALWQRHLIYLVQDRKLDALEELNLILKSNRFHAGAYLSRADLYALTNDVSMAIADYSNAIKYNPNDYQAYYKRAQMYMLRGDTRMAMDDFLTTTKLNPKIHDAWFMHGMNYYNNKLVNQNYRIF